MDVESDVTVKDLVKNLQPALRKFMWKGQPCKFINSVVKIIVFVGNPNYQLKKF